MISGFPAAYFPEMRTVGTFRRQGQPAGTLILPEDSNNGSDFRHIAAMFSCWGLHIRCFIGEKPPRRRKQLVTTPSDPFDGTSTTLFGAFKQTRYSLF